MKRLLRRHLFRVTAVVLLLAVLPNALYLGHWPYFQQATAADATADLHAHHAPGGVAEDAHAAAGHCTVGPGKCTDAPAPTPQPAGLTTESLAAVALGVLLLLAVDLRISPSSPFAGRLTRPPRRTSAVFAS